MVISRIPKIRRQRKVARYIAEQLQLSVEDINKLRQRVLNEKQMRKSIKGVLPGIFPTGNDGLGFDRIV